MRKEQIEEMTEILKNYTKEHNIMASVVILECYAEQLYDAGYRKQSKNTVEIVRCKDCFFGDVDTTGSGSVQCQNRDVPWRRYTEEFVMSPHDYCSYARAKMKGGAE